MRIAARSPRSPSRSKGLITMETEGAHSWPTRRRKRGWHRRFWDVFPDLSTMFALHLLYALCFFLGFCWIVLCACLCYLLGQPLAHVCCIVCAFFSISAFHCDRYHADQKLNDASGLPMQGCLLHAHIFVSIVFFVASVWYWRLR